MAARGRLMLATISAAALGIPFLWPALLRRVLTAPAPGKETR
ncbi:hypothetical protein [Nocardia asiatica]|nr:hypothetical protein [Nocardia asiatica]